MSRLFGFKSFAFAADAFIEFGVGAAPPEPPRTSNGINLIVDPPSGYNAGAIQIGHAVTLIVNAAVDLPTDEELTLHFIKPDGSLYVPAPTSFLYIGEKQLTGSFYLEFYTFFLPGQYAVYTTLPEELDQVGTWTVSVQAGIYASANGFFTVTP